MVPNTISSLGYGGSVGDFSYDIGYATYVYPTGTSESIDKPGELAEYIYSVGYGPVSLTVFDDVDTDYTYTAVGYDIADFSLMYGAHKDGQENFDVTYSYSDSMSFTYSVPFGVDGDVEAEPTFVASYSSTILINGIGGSRGLSFLPRAETKRFA